MAEGGGAAAVPPPSKRLRVDPPSLKAEVGAATTDDAQALTVPPQPPSEEVKACRLPAKATKEERERIRADVTLADRSAYFALNECPIGAETERRMEQVSKVVTNEALATCWDPGNFVCSRCNRVLYQTDNKFQGPCMWPSFRQATSAGALDERPVRPGEYNGYTCEVNEVYCGGCQLFLGHSFRDGKTTGDTHPDADWRHCVLSLSLSFEGATADAPAATGASPTADLDEAKAEAQAVPQ